MSLGRLQYKAVGPIAHCRGGVKNFFHLPEGGVRTFFHVVEGGVNSFFYPPKVIFNICNSNKNK